jgi:hypothetical protein
MRTITIKSETVGEAIDRLAEAFSGEADFMGLYILEMALDRAKEIRSAETRRAEADAIFAKFHEGGAA